MSFGFSVGDFIAAINLANKIRKDFIDAPGQFKAISHEVRNLSIVLQDADVSFPSGELNNEQKRDLEDIDIGCRDVLDELQRIIDQNTELGAEDRGVGKKIRRVWKRLSWKPEDVNQLRMRINSSVSFLTAFNGRLTRDNVVKLVRHQEDQERQTVLDWLTPIDFAAQQSDFISRRQAGTGQWLLESPELQTWAATAQQTLFCPGIPGAGKTILTSVLVDYLYTKIQKDMDNVGIAYLYCNFRRQNEQKAGDLLASLLKQLAQGLPSSSDSVTSLYNSHKDKRTRPTIREITDALQSVGTLYSRIFIVVDALDECQASDGCRTQLLKEIFAFQAKSGANIFTTSRFVLELNEQFKDSMQLEIRASDHDVRRYLDGHMLQLSTCVRRNLALQDEIKVEIVKAVNGMFLLAQLHFDSLKGKTSPKAVRNALDKLPAGSTAYDYAYDDAMKRIEGQLEEEEKLAKRVLSWITYAKRPLTTSELEHALAVELGESELDEENLSPIEDLVSVCCGLVTVDGESGIVRLVHYTTQQYFERTQEVWFPNAEIDIARVCTTYLSFNSFDGGACQSDEEFERRLASNPLYKYAAHNWGHHAREASILIPEVMNFLDTEAAVEASCQSLICGKLFPTGKIYSQKFDKRRTALHLAAKFGVIAVSSSPKICLAIHSKDGLGRTPLSWAAGNGHKIFAKLLLEKGAQVNVRNELGWIPLNYAVYHGEEAIVKLLLQSGSKFDLKDYLGQTPLHVAAMGGHEAVVKLLLQNGAESDLSDADGQTPLFWAAEYGHEAVVKLLLQNGAKSDSRDEFGQTPLSLAVKNGHKAVAELLLQNGAKGADSEDPSG